jgi:S1-C subfamily serine protease
MKKILLFLLLSISCLTFASTNLETCLSGKYPTLCKHHLLTAQQKSEVNKAELRENYSTCASGKYPTLCKHHLLTAQQKSEVNKAELRDNYSTCASGKYPTLCKHHLLTAQQKSEVNEAELRDNYSTCASGKYPTLCKHHLLTAQQKSEVNEAELRDNYSTCASGNYPTLCKHDLLTAKQKSEVSKAELRGNDKNTPTKPLPVVKKSVQDGQAIPASSGSGFAVSSDGYVITNSHVIDGCQDVVIHTPQKDIKMRVISNDPKNDLALLKGKFKPSAVFSLSTERPEILQDIYVAGYPFGYKVSSSVKVTKGIISSLTGIGDDFSNFQMDAAIQSGNSGGPVLDDMGNVVGVAVAKLDAMKMLKDTGSLPENTNFGIKASVVKSVLDSSSVDVPSANKSVISKSQLGKMITDGTYYISCWMTMAQIEKVRSKKVLFSEFD